LLISITKNGLTGPRILVLAPNTPGLPDLEATADGGELAFMRDEFSGVYIDALIGTVTLTGRNSLADALRDGNYSVLHLISHGDCDAVTLTRELVTWQELSRLLSQHHVRLVIAMTCNSRCFADGLLAAGTPQVICTTGEITNTDARQFAREFYGAMVRDMTVAEAVTFAKSRMSEDGARMVLLLPDEEQSVETDPLMRKVLEIEASHIVWRAEIRDRLIQLEKKLDSCSTTNDSSIRSLTNAVLSLVEVFNAQPPK